MTITELQKEIHETAKGKGWWDKERNIGELIALCHSELSEALEDIRNGYAPTHIVPPTAVSKPMGFPIELADVIIRVLDMAAGLDIDMEKAIMVKMNYNKGREYRHGKAF